MFLEEGILFHVNLLPLKTRGMVNYDAVLILKWDLITIQIEKRGTGIQSMTCYNLLFKCIFYILITVGIRYCVSGVQHSY